MNRLFLGAPPASKSLHDSNIMWIDEFDRTDTRAVDIYIHGHNSRSAIRRDSRASLDRVRALLAPKGIRPSYRIVIKVKETGNEVR